MKITKTNIIYIEDEIESMHAFRIGFEEHYNVFLASTKEQVFQFLGEKDIKVVLVDQRMPEISGLDLCKLIHEKHSEVLCIIVTAHCDTGVMQRAINQGGIFQLIMKPWDNEALKQVIDNAIDKYDLINENKKLFEDLARKNHELEEKNEVLTITTEVLKDNEFELVNYNRELLKSKEQIEKSERLKASFLANISHEIRTPLNGILGFIELVAVSKDSVLSERGKKFIKIIKKSSNQLLSIINDLIDISKIESGAVIVKKEKFNIIQEINTITENFSTQLIQNNIDFYITNNLLSTTIETDKHKVIQIIKHLIDNAVKYTLEGEIEVILNESKKNSQEIEICVRDTGIGIDENDYNDIWKRFIQLDLGHLKVNQGNGVGLSLVKSFTELLGGKVWVQSQKNQGSSFYIVLPVNTPSNKHLSKKQKTSFSAMKDFNVLVIESDSANSNYISNLINHMTQKLIIKPNGEEAIETISNENFDIVIINTNLSGIDAEKTAKFIKKINPKTTILGQSKYSFDKKCYEYFDGIIYSPFTKIQLIEKIFEASRRVLKQETSNLN